MYSQSNYCDHRSEPRFHPNFEQVRWRKSGRAELQAGELLDVSNMGLSFRIAPGQDPPLKRGEELAVGFLGSDNRPLRYAVVWERWAAGRLAIGCARLTSDDPVPMSRIPPPKLMLAMSRRSVGQRQEDIELETRSVTFAAKPSQMA